MTARAWGPSSSSVRLRWRADAEVDLGDGLDAAAAGDVDEQRRHRRRSPATNGSCSSTVAAAGVLAGQRLHDRRPAEGRTSTSSGPGDQLGDPPAAVPAAADRAGRRSPSRTRRPDAVSSGPTSPTTKRGAEVARCRRRTTRRGRRRPRGATSTAPRPCPGPSPSSGSTSATRRPPRAAGRRGDAAVSSVEWSSTTMISSTSGTCVDEVTADRVDDRARWWRPRCGPAGTPRSAGRPCAPRAWPRRSRSKGKIRHRRRPHRAMVIESGPGWQRRGPGRTRGQRR